MKTKYGKENVHAPVKVPTSVVKLLLYLLCKIAWVFLWANY